MRVLHVVEQLRRGGPLQALIAVKKQSRLAGAIAHHIVSIKPADARAIAQAMQARIAVTAPAPAQLPRLMQDADIVQVHFWNSPEIHALLAGELPPLRLLLWCHVNGQNPPHIIPASLVARADLAWATAPSTLELPAFRAADPARVVFIPSLADFERLSGLVRVDHDDFRVGYVGNVDFAKLHESYVSMCAAADVPAARFVVCGDGGAAPELKRQASGLGILDRFEFTGHLDDIRPVLQQLDVLGYPLAEGTSATSELALQEAMYAGIPPVVLPHGGPGRAVQNGSTGIVANGPSEYSAAIRWLHDHPQERRRLGDNAARAMRELVRKHEGAADAVYLRMMEGPKRPRRAVARGRTGPHALDAGGSGAWSFVRSLDGTGAADFITSLRTTDEDAAQAAEARIAGSSADLHEVVLQYRFFDPADPHLRLWAALVLRARGRPALAAAELTAAIAGGLDRPRVRRYLQESVSMAQGAGGARVQSP